MKSMYIGSGEVSNLMSGIHTKGYAKLLQRFVSDEIPYYNAKASPIDAMRSGAILEDRYILLLGDDYYPQIKVTSPQMDVFKCSLDFSKLLNSKVVKFEELKTCSFADFLNLEPFREDNDGGVEYIKKKYKKYYNQIQQQIFCTNLEEAVMTFLVVYSYKDEDNYLRDIKETEYIKFTIKRDQAVIDKIKERGLIFQQIKDYFKSEEDGRSK